MPQLDGTYTRKTGLKRTYHYTLTYGVRGVALSWMAAVHFGGEVKGHPEGEISYGLPPPEEEQRATAEQKAQEAIESLDGVEE